MLQSHAIGICLWLHIQSHLSMLLLCWSGVYWHGDDTKASKHVAVQITQRDCYDICFYNTIVHLLVIIKILKKPRFTYCLSCFVCYRERIFLGPLPLQTQPLPNHPRCHSIILVYGSATSSYLAHLFIVQPYKIFDYYISRKVSNLSSSSSSSSSSGLGHYLLFLKEFGQMYI